MTHPAVNPAISKEHQQDEDLVNNEPGANPTVAATRLSGTDSDNTVDSPEGSNEGSTFVERKLYNPFDGTRGRAGGVYLDVEERINAEILRAKQEGREPDLDNPPATAGTPLTVDAMRVDNTFSNPASAVVNPVKNVDPVSALPVDVGIAPKPIDTSVLEQHLAEANARNEAAGANAQGTSLSNDSTLNEGTTTDAVSTPTPANDTPDDGTTGITHDDGYAPPAHGEADSNDMASGSAQAGQTNTDVTPSGESYTL